MPVLELVNERAIFDVEQVEGAKNSGDAARATLVIEGFVGRQHYGRVIDAQYEAKVVLEVLLPGIPRIPEIRLDLALDGIGAAEAGARCLFRSGRKCQQRGRDRKNYQSGQNCHVFI